MFSQLVVPVAIFCLMLLVPGYLLLRILQLPRAWSICVAPIVSIGLVSIVGEIYGLLRLPATPVSVYAPLVVVLGIGCLVSLLLFGGPRSQAGRRGGKKLSRGRSDAGADAGRNATMPHIAWWWPLLFVAIGLFVCNNVFLSELDSPGAVLQSYDVIHHLNTIQTFVDAQRISSLGVNPYLSAADAAIMPYGVTATYPSAWYAVCALLVQAAGISVPVAINASLVVFTGVVLPLGMLGFAAMTFDGDRKSILAAALTCVAFAMFPWCMLLFGPLYPNLAGFATLPATLTIFMLMLGQGLRFGQRIPFGLGFFVASAGQALLHPNTLFSLFLIMIPYCVWRLYTYLRVVRQRGIGLALGAAAIFVAACAGVWTLCFRSPAFGAIVGEYWPGFAYKWQEVINILTQTYTLGFFTEIAAQVLLGVLVVIGFVRALYASRVRWLAVSYLVVCGENFIAATSMSILVKQFATGFWYTDAMRLAAMAILLAAPLAAYGFAWAFETICALVARYNDAREKTSHPAVVAVVMAITFFLVNFMTGFNWPGAHSTLSNTEFEELKRAGREYETLTVKTTFGDYRQSVRNSYNFNIPMDQQEQAFLDEVAQIVPKGALVINNPMDGSFLAYGGRGIRIYYREFGYAGSSTETKVSETVRTRLCDLASDEDVRKAVEAIGAHYVLVMNEQNSKESFINLRGDYAPEDYVGISSITADTPGFTPILSNGACTLYSID